MKISLYHLQTVKTLQVVTNLKEAHDSKGDNIAESIEKGDASNH